MAEPLMTCPKCRKKGVGVPREAHDRRPFKLGCNNCGHVLTQEQVKRAMADATAEALKKLGPLRLGKRK